MNKKFNFKILKEVLISFLKVWAPIIISTLALLLSYYNYEEKKNIQNDLDEIENLRLLNEYQPKVRLVGKPI